MCTYYCIDILYDHEGVLDCVKGRMCVYMYVCVCMYVCVYGRKSMSCAFKDDGVSLYEVCVYIHVCVCVCIRVCMCVYIYIYAVCF